MRVVVISGGLSGLGGALEAPHPDRVGRSGGE